MIRAAKTCSCLVLFFLASLLWAQDEEIFRHPLNAETMEAFKTTCTRLAEHPFIKGTFEQEKILSRLKRSLKSEGNFIIADQTGMVWETLKPFPSTLALGRDYLIQSRPGGQKNAISAQGNETFLRLAEVISAVFSGQAQGLLDNFEIFFKGSGTAGPAAGNAGSAAWELGLCPLNRAIGSFAEKIIMKGDTAIRSILINEQNGDTTSYILSNHSYPAELTINERSFFTYP